MITDLDEIERRMRNGFSLRNRGEGWKLEAPKFWMLKRWQMPDTLEVPADLVALLSAQGLIRTELRVVVSEHWVEPQNMKGVM